MTTTLSWDDVGSKYYETGVDRAVLYPPSGPGIPWNGLVSVKESVGGGDSEAMYFDGIKYAVFSSLTEFAGTLQAYTYPEEFLEFEGVASVGSGLFVANQEVKRFGLTYRTRIGNDVDGFEHGYKIHILYNLTAVPSDKEYTTFTNNSQPILFEWGLTAIPTEIPGFRPSAHLIFDTRFMDPILIQDVENALYGDGISDPALPKASILAGFISSFIIIRITDNHDGSFTIEGPDDLIILLEAGKYQINRANTVAIDSNTYRLSDLSN